MGDLRIALLCQDGVGARVIYNRLRREFTEPISVIAEEPTPKWQLIRGRYRKLGVRTVAGQLAFQALVQPTLQRASAARVREVARDMQLDTSPIPGSVLTRVPSVNSEQCRALLREYAPRIVVLGGTRIVGEATLNATPATFINMHAGITPGYRGVHGGYWALADGRPDLVGTTIHVVDRGIDTGGVIEQVFFAPDARDNFATYPLLHIAYGLPALVRAIRGAARGNIETVAGAAHPSQLRYHPTLLQYVGQALLRGVR